MANKEKVEPTPESGTETTDKEKKVSTSERLFPETFQAPDEAAPEATPQAKAEDSTPDATIDAEAKAQEPEVKAEDYLDLEASKGKKLKLKVDGVESETTIADLIAQAQLKKHLDQAAQKVGEERRLLAEERRLKAEEERARTFRQPSQEAANSLPAQNSNDPLVQQLLREVQDLKASQYALQPVIYNSNRQRVADEIKAETGFADFNEFLPKMEAFISTEKDPAKVQYYDTEIGAKHLYLMLKTKELSSAAQAPKTAAPVRPAAPIQKIDGGRNKPSQAPSDDWKAKYDSAFDRYKKSGGKDQRAMEEMLRIKGALA